MPLMHMMKMDGNDAKAGAVLCIFGTCLTACQQVLKKIKVPWQLYEYRRPDDISKSYGVRA